MSAFSLASNPMGGGMSSDNEPPSPLDAELLARVAHDLRSPLSAMVIWTGLLRQEHPGSAESLRAIEMIERSSRALGRQINALADVSHVMSPTLRLDMQDVSLAAIATSAANGVRDQANERNVTIAVERGLTDDTVRGDSLRLSQALGHLMSLAVDVARESERVLVAIGTRGGSLTCVITGNPEGRPSAARGASAGEMVARRIIELHGGKVETTAGMKGGPFTITLPRAADQARG
jgi:signal transduction histidine kinase